MPVATAKTVTDGKPHSIPKRPGLRCAPDTRAARRFRALPAKDRDRLLEEFRAACAPAFSSVEEYLTEKRQEKADNHHDDHDT